MTAGARIGIMLARIFRGDPTHYVTNLLIEPTAEGAMGVAYHVGWAVEDTPGRAVYYDQLVKTPEGWRFKKRSNTIGSFTDDLLQALEQ